jgi:hypothetical protein
LSRFQLLHECENTYGDSFGLKEVWQVYYNPPKLRIMNALSLSSGLVMQFLGDVLLDTTPSHCYLNSSYVRCIGLYVQKNNDKVVLGNGLEIELEGSVNVHVKIQQYQS